uniref:G-protein coupled receptors family 1 profile domain-containing protein n=1 Tax=Laticauda laticaudata TaxID=8630 RepID=A0A8C5S5C8_LATLA
QYENSIVFWNNGCSNGKFVIYSLIILICIPGMIGNGIVIQLLGCKIKRNSFTVYILNLAMADNGTLLFLFLIGILYLNKRLFPLIITESFICIYCIGQFFLTIISIDRCLALFFPIWYRYHQPLHLSTALCVFSWLISFFLCVIHYALLEVKLTKSFPSFYHILICTTICIPLMVVSSLALFIKGYLKSQNFSKSPCLPCFTSSSSLFHQLPFISVRLFKHNSVNPLIYFLLGRKKEHHSTYNLNIILQKVFKEEEENEKETSSGKSSIVKM